MYSPENKSHQYQPPDSITLGIFDLISVRTDTIIRLAHLRLVRNPKDMIAKKLIAENENHHPLKDNLVERLFQRMGILQFFADLPVQGRQLQRVCRVSLLDNNEIAVITVGRLPIKDKVEGWSAAPSRPHDPNDLTSYLHYN